ncbi:tRNA methyltransferase 10 homolog C [Sceloporus undulatus]|uniref:tRNA methyltransferase 10 homolog C n=1 Tax=Sceloporus undulatus TaxID=8520 RepID=UPI001C4C702F|nr:tRNA methyltransferase 10 homolog C [Sceloporus undulatus]XP_042316594.1 tRNA methyltransferase 10 homolog C [Sceloporus undulatus]XP_042316595.1 tRNA methyltransferase 10 homolog C [Sceloporus undulatus]
MLFPRMNILSMHLLNAVRRSVFQLAVQDGMKRGVFLVMPSKVMMHRTLFLSACLNKNTAPDTTEKLDLDGWKHVMRTAVQEESSEGTSDSEEDSRVAATRELIEMWRLSGKAVPENISEEQLKILMDSPTKSSKKKYLQFLAKKENMKKAAKEKKKQKAAKTEISPEAQDYVAGELKNTFLLKFWSRSEDAIYNWRAAQAMIFGQPLVFDMDYENCMSRREMENAVKQLMESEGINRRGKDPFHLHYCNLKTGGLYHKELIRRYGDAWDNLFVTVTEKAYNEIFPRDQIVYLTADSPNIMKKFEHDKIYIIGSLVDKSIQTGVSLARAKRLNLATARLPLDKYLQWEEGAKNLTLNQMMSILLTLKDTGDWKDALQFVPRRKHAGFMEMSLSKDQIDAWKKTKMHERTVGKEKSHRSFAGNSSRWQVQKKWWEDVS